MAGYIGSRASVVSSGAERKKTFDITGTTTSLTGLSYTVNQVHVFHNGVRLVDGTDFTATNGSSITLTSAAESGDEVVVLSYAGYQVSDTVSASQGGTFSGNVEFSGDIELGDNDKAIFGNGSDLQIYHDGTDNYVDAAGVGHLYLQSQGDDKDVKILSDDGSGGLTEYFRADGSIGKAQMFYYGTKTLETTSTGIDVTGEITADGLTVDGATEIKVSGSGSAVDALKVYNTSGSINDTQVQVWFGANDYDTSGRGLLLDAGRDSGADGLAIFYAVDQGEHSDYEAIKISTDGGVKLSHLGANKLATTTTGIDVTGEVTADGLTVDGDGKFSGTVVDVNIIETDQTNLSTQLRQTAGQLRFRTVSNDLSAATERMRIDHATGDISFYEDTGTTAKLTWSASDEALEFADNGKAIFGAGSDLQIYHDGSNSYIADEGTGELRLEASSLIRMMGNNGETLAVFNEDGAVSLRHDGAAKLATTSTGIDVTGTVTADELSTTALVTNQIRGTGNIIEYHADYDANSGANQGHLFFSNNSDNPWGGFFQNDFYVQDNINVGRYYKADGTLQYHTDGVSALTLYSSNTTTGPAAYKNYTQILSRNSTDPDYGIIMASSAYVESQTLDTAENDQHAFVIDNGGRFWAWQSYFAGRTRKGDTGTTANYRVGDHSFTCYSNTGGTHGDSSNNGYTQIVGRETANSDMVFRVSVAGSDRIHFYANGNGYFDGGADLGNADYAEYFEWADGKPNNEDRRGYSVVLENGKIRIATSEDNVNDLIGIVSVQAAICGDAAHMAWQGKYQLDKFGARVTQDVNHTCWMDKPDGDHHESDQWDYKYTDEYIAANNIEVPDHAQVIVTQEPVESEEYDPQTEYIPRADRPEWSPIGLMGKLPLLKGEPVHPRWIKLYEMNDELDMWLVR